MHRISTPAFVGSNPTERANYIMEYYCGAIDFNFISCFSNINA